MIRFPLDGTGKNIGRIFVSVKGGKAPGPAAVRDLAGAVEAQRAEMGLLITFNSSPTNDQTRRRRCCRTWRRSVNSRLLPSSRVCLPSGQGARGAESAHAAHHARSDVAPLGP